jgi:alpha-beta hydrolase superfamily lysophospholipase
VIRHRLDIDVSAVAGFPGPAHVAAELLLPEGQAPELLFVCLPGGGMNRRYFDLPTPEGEAEVSFALAMAARGHAVALLDPLGAGESTSPDDVYLVHPDRMADAARIATDRILTGIREGSFDPRCPAAPDVRSVGAAHSLGALITVVQQAASGQHRGLALMGFHTGGVAEHLTDDDRALDLEHARANLVDVARKRFPVAFHELQPQPSKRAVSAASAIERIMMTPSLMAMLPNIVAKDAASITVPVLIALGDADLHGDPYRTPQAYSSSPEVTLLVLPETKHNHFVYPSRTHLFERVARWAENLP